MVDGQTTMYEWDVVVFACTASDGYKIPTALESKWRAQELAIPLVVPECAIVNCEADSGTDELDMDEMWNLVRKCLRVAPLRDNPQPETVYAVMEFIVPQNCLDEVYELVVDGLNLVNLAVSEVDNGALDLSIADYVEYHQGHCH
eukprot:1755862-Amphidinium_carterae.1